MQAEFGDLYSSDNVMLTASHTHASAGGFHEYFLYHITSWGYVKQSFDVLVEGIMEVGG
jgi:neutral ceramidase